MVSGLVLIVENNYGIEYRFIKNSEKGEGSVLIDIFLIYFVKILSSQWHNSQDTLCSKGMTGLNA